MQCGACQQYTWKLNAEDIEEEEVTWEPDIDECGGETQGIQNVIQNMLSSIEMMLVIGIHDLHAKAAVLEQKEHTCFVEPEHNDDRKLP